MAKIDQLKDKHINEAVYPITVTKAVLNENNVSLDNTIEEIKNSIEDTATDIKGLNEKFLNPIDTNGYEYVDMGEAGVWATCNIGANSPEEAGSYFAWGETEPKDSYTLDNYKFGTNSNLTKYDNYDGLTTLELIDDAAYINMGGDWRMPTLDDFNKLYDSCYCTIIPDYKGTGIPGKSFKLYSDPTKQIFIPSLGMYKEGAITGSTEYGTCWTSSLTSTVSNASAVNVDTTYATNKKVIESYARYYGCNIRAFIPARKEKYITKDEAEEKFATKKYSTEIGGRNLVLDSNVEKTSSSNDVYILSEYLIPGETYTISVWWSGEVAPTKPMMWVASVGNITELSTPVNNISITRFVAPSSKFLRFYLYRADIPAAKIKVERGEIATDWTPAPEDGATKLKTPIKLWSQEFDGSKDIDGDIVIEGGSITADFINTQYLSLINHFDEDQELSIDFGTLNRIIERTTNNESKLEEMSNTITQLQETIAQLQEEIATLKSEE